MPIPRRLVTRLTLRSSTVPSHRTWGGVPSMVGKSPKYMEVVILWLRVVPRETLRIALRNTFGLQHGSSPSTAGFTTIHEIFSIPRGEHSGASNFWMPQELAFMFSLFPHIRVSQAKNGPDFLLQIPQIPSPTHIALASTQWRSALFSMQPLTTLVDQIPMKSLKKFFSTDLRLGKYWHDPITTFVCTPLGHISERGKADNSWWITIFCRPLRLSYPRVSLCHFREMNLVGMPENKFIRAFKPHFDNFPYFEGKSDILDGSHIISYHIISCHVKLSHIIISYHIYTPWHQHRGWFCMQYWQTSFIRSPWW